MNCILCNWSSEIDEPGKNEYLCKIKDNEKIEDVTKVCGKYSSDIFSGLFSPGIVAN